MLESTLRSAERLRDDPGLGAAMAAWGRQQEALAAETARFFLDLDLTMAQFRALAVLRRRGRMTGRELAGHLGVTPGTVVPLCDRLEEQGYLRRVPDAADRRLTWLELTPKGQRLFHRLWRAGGEKIAAAMARLSADDQRSLARLLNQVAACLEVKAR
jgi:DNA-binding MarR family transcriptional regulator